MATTTFINRQTPIMAEWLNDVDDITYRKNAEWISVKDPIYGAVGDDSTDDTAAIQAAIDAAEANGKKVFIPAGTYKITSSLTITNEITFQGDGANQSIIKLYTATDSVFAITVDVASNSSFIGSRLGSFSLVCNGGAASACGLRIQTTATNSAVSQCVFENIFIKNCKIGVSVTGVVYMTTFRNITVSGTVTEYGWYITSAQEIIYCSFEDLEVTNVGDAAYAYYFQTLACQWRNLTADGVCYFSAPYGAVRGIAVEGISATTPATSTVITLNQLDSIEDVAIINCPTAKTNIGISVMGYCAIRNVRFPDSGAGNQPDQALYLAAGSNGTVLNWQTGRAMVAKVESGSLAADVNNWVFTACSAITDHDFSYEEGSWTPAYATWNTAPSTVSARYIKMGRMVTVTLYGENGVTGAGDTVTGLPFTSSATNGSAVAGSCGDTTIKLSGSIVASTTTISNLPAATLTGTFWQLTGTYFI